jgi:hypothetical protein
MRKSLVFALPLLLAGCVSSGTTYVPSQAYTQNHQVFLAPDPTTGVSTPYVATPNGVFVADLKVTPFTPISGN